MLNARVKAHDSASQKKRYQLLAGRNRFASACVNFAIVLCIFTIWTICSPMAVPNRAISTTHIRHLMQRGSGVPPVPLPASKLTPLGLHESDVALVLFPRSWQNAGWSRVVFRFHNYVYDVVKSIEVHSKCKTVAYSELGK